MRLTPHPAAPRCSFDNDDFVGGAEKMAVVARDAPDSLMVQMFYDEARDRAADRLRDRARDAGRLLLQGVF